MNLLRISVLLATGFVLNAPPPARADHLRELQSRAIAEGRADWGHWGANPDKYSDWKTHSNRLIPVYTFGIGLDAVAGEKSVYRDAARLETLYGRLPEATVNPQAEYFDQTDVHALQVAAVAAGKKYVILIVFDGMDWQTTWAAATFRSGSVGYREGRGTGLAFQDYAGAETAFGAFVSSPHNHGTPVDVDAQVVQNPGGVLAGGYDAARGGEAPWSACNPLYLMCLTPDRLHAITDSASSATSLTAGIKTYNDAINVDWQGGQVAPLAHRLQDQGWAIGVVTSVPISHATPACAYAQNVTRDDYQDLTRDLVGLPSVAHRQQPLAGVDVLIGTGWGESRETDEGQGTNFMPGNRYLADIDRAAIDAAQGGKYVIAERTSGHNGGELLADAARQAAESNRRLLGYFGFGGSFSKGSSHLPFQTADGRHDPVAGANPAEAYTEADVAENPTLAEMTAAALTVLERDADGFWLMVEAGDVDWANHDNNLDNSVGAVLSGDEAFRAVVDWIDARDGWADTAVIVTADHGHMLTLTRPEALVGP